MITIRRTLSFFPLWLLVLWLPAGCNRSSVEQSSGTEAAATTTLADEPAELVVLGQVPEFSLVDQSGRDFNSSQMQGKVWVVTFVFTRCGATCPAQTAAFTKLQDSLKRSGAWGHVELVSITVDPEFDTPEVLAKYGKAASADFEHWHFLTGDRATIWDLSKDSFKLPVMSPRDGDELISHSPMFILIDGENQIRSYYMGVLPQANEKLKKDIVTLLDQQTPDWKDQVRELAVPDDVRDPAWLSERAAAQRESFATANVRHDFKFVDIQKESGILFTDKVVEDVKKTFKAAHYDHGSAVAVADIDNDRLLDLYFVCQLGENELWRNLGDGKFENITATAGVAVPDEVSVGASFADINNDGNVDLYVTRVRAPNKLFVGDGHGHFEDISESAGVDYVGHSSGSVFFDYDRDGLLDLLLTNVGKYTTEDRGEGFYSAYAGAFTGHLHADRGEASILYRNLGGLRFENVNEVVGFNDISWTGDATPIDANDDGWLDIYLLNMQGHDEYYENQSGKGFLKKSREVFPQTAWGTMGVKVFDYDRDRQLDLFITDMHTDMVHDLEPHEEKMKMRRNLPLQVLATDGNHQLGNTFFRKRGKDSFEEISDRINAENYWPWGISVGDLNADGFEDVFVAASMNYPYRYGINSLLLNDSGKTFVDSEFVLGIEPRAKGTSQPWMELDCSGTDRDNRHCKDCGGKVLVMAATGTRSSVMLDIEGDGDLDIVTNDFGGTPMVLRSNLSEQPSLNYLKIELIGSESNRDGLGATVLVHAGEQQMLSVHDGKSGYLAQSRLPLYFGLGSADLIDKIEINWPSGARQTVSGPIPSNQLLTIREQSNDEAAVSEK
jgi:cytochrome oxidase Cu insertion factor (SCO1/SenC/PrrC family)